MIFSDTRIKEITGIYYYSPQKSQFTAKNRTEQIIGIQLSGDHLHTFANRSFTLGENTIYFLNQKEDYHVKVKERGVSLSIHFTTYEPIEVESFCIHIQEGSGIINMIECIEQHYMRSAKATAHILSDVYKLLANYEKLYTKKYHSKDIRIQQAKEYINLHFKEKDCVINAAEEYGVTPRRFNDLFKQHFNLPPNQYIIHYKINLAKRLLLSKELSITEISVACGFDNVYYFSKIFKKVVGCTASEYRNKL